MQQIPNKKQGAAHLYNKEILEIKASCVIDLESIHIEDAKNNTWGMKMREHIWNLTKLPL